MNRLIPLLVFSFATMTAVAAPLIVQLEVPAQVDDATPVQGRVRIVSEEGAILPAPSRGSTLTLSVRLIASTGQRQCVVERRGVPASLAPDAPTLTLAPGAATVVDVDVLADYPLGLPPGEYVLQATYAGVKSAPARLLVTVPAGATSGAYHEFSTICAALVRWDRAAAGPALAFAQNHPQFLFTRGLLDLASTRSEGSLRQKITSYLRERFAGSLEAQAALLDEEGMERRAATFAEAERHRAMLAQALENAPMDERIALQQLGTISAGDDFAGYESFLARYPRSVAAPDVLYGMMIAVEEGITPRGIDANDRGKLLQVLRERLQREYPRSDRAHQLSQ
jgi:hypothetical protein